MKILDPAVAASLPETVVLDILTSVLESTIIVLLAAHPRLERDDHPAEWCSRDAPSACCIANAIIDVLYTLDDAIVAYRRLVEDELEAERPARLPF